MIPFMWSKARGIKLIKVQMAKLQAGNEPAMMAKPVHSTISQNDWDRIYT